MLNVPIREFLWVALEFGPDHLLIKSVRLADAGGRLTAQAGLDRVRCINQACP